MRSATRPSARSKTMAMRYDAEFLASRRTNAVMAAGRGRLEREVNDPPAALDVLVAVCRDHDRDLRTPVDGCPEPRTRCLVERPRRLVEQKERWRAGERPREGDLLDHPRRALVH